MKIHHQGYLNSFAKAVAPLLSTIIASRIFYGFSCLVESYFSILLGKGAGTGWAFDAEINCAKKVIDSVKDGDDLIFFDVGANKGDWTSAMKRRYPNALVLMFEPQSDCCEELRKLPFKNLTLFPFAVDSQRRKVAVYTTGGLSGLASLHKRQDTYFSNLEFTSFDVQTVALDDIIDEQQIKRIDFIKMDIEGHELEALKGARNALSSGIVKALSFEFGSANINSRTYFKDFWTLLSEYQYEIYRILPSGNLVRIDEYYEDCEHFRGVTNYVAVLKGGSRCPI
jgi:FkbM family methyltransferase